MRVSRNEFTTPLVNFVPKQAFQAKITFRSPVGTPIRLLFLLMGPQKAQWDEL